MATVDQFRTTSAPQHSGFLNGLFTQFRVWRDRVATAQALAELTPRQLEDLGLSNKDVADIAAGIRPASRF